MQDQILSIRKGLEEGIYQNEAAVSQGILMRVLAALDWPTYDPQVVAPEYTLEGRRVDFALCPTGGTPAVFIEAKKVGQAEGADRQLFEYAFHKGVPLAVLTDGREWTFFLPLEQGEYDERRLYKLDMMEREPAEIEERFVRYLDYKAVCSGEALKQARADYLANAKKRDIQKTLPVAWQKLLEEKDELLLELIADKVESLCGYKPEPDVVSSFLSKWSKAGEPVTVTPAPPISPERKRPTPSPHLAGAYRISICDDTYSASTAKDILVHAFEELTRRDSAFPEKFAQVPHGRTRRWLARKPEELYPGNPDLSGYCHRLDAKWVIGTNYSKREIERIITRACEVAGLSLARDVEINLGPSNH